MRLTCPSLSVPHRSAALQGEREEETCLDHRNVFAGLFSKSDPPEATECLNAVALRTRVIFVDKKTAVRVKRATSKKWKRCVVKRGYFLDFFLLF